MKVIIFLLVFSLHDVLAFCQDKAVFTVDVKKPTAKVSPTMWGVFFEDINMGADGGLYAELVKNRSFEFYTPKMGWNIGGSQVKEGDFLILNRGTADSTNPHYLRIKVHNANDSGD